VVVLVPHVLLIVNTLVKVFIFYHCFYIMAWARAKGALLPKSGIF
jgi:hypothetical protein